jgi:hypothetical protein
MKLGEYQEWMTNLATISGCSAEMLEKTPARVLFALNVAIEERNRAREERDALAKRGTVAAIVDDGPRFEQLLADVGEELARGKS